MEEQLEQQAEQQVPAPEAAGIIFFSLQAPSGGTIHVTLRTFREGVEAMKELTDQVVEYLGWAKEAYDLVLGDSVPAEARRAELRAKVMPKAQSQVAQSQDAVKQTGKKDGESVINVRSVKLIKAGNGKKWLVVSGNDGGEYFANEKVLPGEYSFGDFRLFAETEPPEGMERARVKDKNVLGFE